MADFAIMLPGRARERVYLRPSFGLYTAVGFDVSTSSGKLDARPSRFLF